MSIPPPIVGSWYTTATKEMFEVVAWDPDERMVEVQFYDGTIGEYDLDGWGELQPHHAEPPEDWSGSLDVGADDYGVDLDQPAGDNHHNPLDDIS